MVFMLANHYLSHENAVSRLFVFGEMQYSGSRKTCALLRKLQLFGFSHLFRWGEGVRCWVLFCRFLDCCYVLLGKVVRVEFDLNW